MTTTFEEIITEYADRLGNALGVEVNDDDRTRNGFPGLLETCANRLSGIDQMADWLQEAANDLDAINRLGDDSDKAQSLLKQVDAALYDAVRDIELSC